jgi:hypothetical protein
MLTFEYKLCMSLATVLTDTIKNLGAFLIQNFISLTCGLCLCRL